MKVLFGIKAMNNPGGGAERVLAAIASGFSQRGHEVALLSFDAPGGAAYYPLNGAIKRLELGIGDTTGPSGLFDTARRISAMRSVIQDYSPDLVVGFMHSMFLPLALSLAGLRIPLIASEHIVYQHYANRGLQRGLLWLLSNQSALMLCVSEEARSTYPKIFHDRIKVVPNPVTIAVEGRADVVAPSKNRKLLLSVGRFDSQKDHATLIEAFARVAGKHPDWDLRVVGDGSLREPLEQQIARLGLENRVSLPGSRREVASEYRDAQLFVLPSRYESFSLTTAEALAHGLPVVAFSDCPAIGHLIKSGENGVLVTAERSRVEPLADALDCLMRDPELRKRLAAGAQPLPEYSLGGVLNRWEEICAEVASSRRAPN
ncbi:MAG: glycosyltransferase family 4 protein [Methyloceanibacter sp.]